MDLFVRGRYPMLKPVLGFEQGYQDDEFITFSNPLSLSLSGLIPLRQGFGGQAG